MLLDQHLMMSDAQTLTATAASSEIIDQGGKGDAHNRLIALCKVNAAFEGLTKLKVELQSAKTADFANAKSVISAEFAAADLTGDACLFKTVLPMGSQRFLRGYYTVTGTATAGSVSLFITDEADM